MPLLELDHYFVRANDLERSCRFYCEVLGFEQMPRPQFGFPGYWLGVNGRIQVHMGPHGIPEAERYYFGTSAGSATDNAGVVDHIAFLASEPEAFARRLDALGVPTRRRHFPEIELLQIFVTDPDGLTIELSFPGTAVEPAWTSAGQPGAA